MKVHFRHAVVDDAEAVSGMVILLTEEISVRTNAKHFSVSLKETIARTRSVLESGKYGAVLGFSGSTPVALATFTESYALYAAGKIGIIPEFYVSPEYRSQGVGEELLKYVKAHGAECEWACIELCTPPLPEFERTLKFYQANGLVPVGGRKMRENLLPRASG